MPIDTSMYSGNPGEGFAKSFSSIMEAKSMSDLSRLRAIEAQKAMVESQKAQQDWSDDQAVRNAVKSNTVVDPNTGATSINHAGVMANLGKSDNPMLAQKYNLQMQQQNADQMSKQIALGKQLAWSINTSPDATPEQKQAAWDNATSQAMKMGLPGAAEQPRQYPGDSYVKNLQYSFLSPEEKLTQHKQDLQTQVDQQNANSNTLKSQAEAANAGIPYGGGRGGSASAPSNAVASNGKGIPANQLSDQDPADMLKRVPMKDREKVAAEIDAAKNATENGPKIMGHFDNAYGQHAIDYVPGFLNADQKGFHALLGPTFKDVEGTVRQAAMDNMFGNTTPQFGDNGNTKDVKRGAVKDYLQYKSSAALSKSYGIDLSKYKSTNVKAALDQVDSAKNKTAAIAPPSGATKSWEGKTYKVVGDHWVLQSDDKEASK